MLRRIFFEKKNNGQLQETPGSRGFFLLQTGEYAESVDGKTSHEAPIHWS